VVVAGSEFDEHVRLSRLQFIELELRHSGPQIERPMQRHARLVVAQVRREVQNPAATNSTTPLHVKLHRRA